MDIGFYLLDIDNNNELHRDILKCINEVCKKYPYANIILFNNQFNALDIDHKYYILHINQAKYFKGILFVFDAKSAMITQTFPSPKYQVLYCKNTEWSRDTSAPYGFWNNIYNRDNFELITSNQETYDLLEICWKKPLSLIQSINSEEISDVISKLQKSN